MFRAFLQKTLLSQKTVLEAALRKSQADAAKAETTLGDKVVFNRQLSGKVGPVGGSAHGANNTHCASGCMLTSIFFICDK